MRRGGSWKKGQSGNLKGRPRKGAETVSLLIEKLEGDRSEKVVERLLVLALCKEKAISIRAITEIFKILQANAEFNLKAEWVERLERIEKKLDGKNAIESSITV